MKGYGLIVIQYRQAHLRNHRIVQKYDDLDDVSEGESESGEVVVIIGGVGDGVEGYYVGKSGERGGGINCEWSADVILEGAVVDGRVS